MKPRSRTAVLSADPVMAALVRAVGRYALQAQAARTPFESLARAIAHQQLSGVVAQRILQRFCALYPGCPFPTPAAVLATPPEQLRAVGFSFAKIRALHDLAEKTRTGIVPPGEALQSLDDDTIIERLSSVRGIGRWTVEMLLMFQMERPDVWPVDDFGVRNGFRLAYGLKRLPTSAALRDFGERWRPHRSAAAWYLWRAVDLHRAGTLPPPLRPAPRIAQQKPKVSGRTAAGTPPRPPGARTRTRSRRGSRSRAPASRK